MQRSSRDWVVPVMVKVGKGLMQSRVNLGALTYELRLGVMRAHLLYVLSAWFIHGNYLRFFFLPLTWRQEMPPHLKIQSQAIALLLLNRFWTDSSSLTYLKDSALTSKRHSIVRNISNSRKWRVNHIPGPLGWLAIEALEVCFNFVIQFKLSLSSLLCHFQLTCFRLIALMQKVDWNQ